MLRLLLAFLGAAVTLAALAAEALPSPDPDRGEKVFQRYCALCHGPNADGRGRAAARYKPPPANLVRSPYPDEYKELIIRVGGRAVGRSQFMPPWGEELSAQQIRDVVAYLRRIKAPS
jgi:mono/diheme cytochrome c family protein